MADLHLVTGYAGEAHITAADHGSLNAAVFGEGDYVLNRGNKLSASYIGNNTIRVLDGDLLIQGRHARLDAGSYIDLTISTISSSYKRNVLICAKYTRNSSTGVEACTITTLTGTMTTGTPKDPSVTTGNVLTGAATTHYFPLYRVLVSGTTIGEPEQLFETLEVVKVGADGKIASGYLPSLNYVPTSQKGAANGVAPLDSDKKVPVENLPCSSATNSASTVTLATSSAVKAAYDKAVETAAYEKKTTTDGEFVVSSFKCGRTVICVVDFTPEEAVSWANRDITLHYAPCLSCDMAASVYVQNASGAAHSLVLLTSGNKSATISFNQTLQSTNTITATFTYFTAE